MVTERAHNFSLTAPPQKEGGLIYSSITEKFLFHACVSNILLALHLNVDSCSVQQNWHSNEQLNAAMPILQGINLSFHWEQAIPSDTGWLCLRELEVTITLILTQMSWM